MNRIGVLGGTFDPPHVGHLIVASDAVEGARLDRLLFVPAAIPPHKRARVRASAGQRLEMLRAATARDPRFDVDDLEVRRGGPSYTVDTLRELRARDPDSEIFFVLGADQLRELDRWREPAEVARLARLLVAARDGDTLPDDARFPARSVPVTRIDISATEVRRRVAAGVSIAYLVPDAVRSIIERDGLYKSFEV